MDHSKCEQPFGASKALFDESGLIKWDGNAFQLVHSGTCDKAFEVWLGKRFDHNYGRYTCWVLFWVAAENLAKAACICAGTVAKDEKGNYPTLGNLKKPVKSACSKAKFSNKDRDLLVENWSALSIRRNRDTHFYEMERRQADYPELQRMFVPMFNILVKMMDKSHLED